MAPTSPTGYQYISVRPVKNDLILTVNDARIFTADDVNLLKAELSKHANKAKPAQRIVLDLKNVEYVILSAIKDIEAAGTVIQEKGGTFIIAGVNPAVKTFEMHRGKPLPEDKKPFLLYRDKTAEEALTQTAMDADLPSRGGRF